MEVEKDLGHSISSKEEIYVAKFLCSMMKWDIISYINFFIYPMLWQGELQNHYD